MSTSTQDTVTGPTTAAPAAASVEQLAAHLTSLSNQDVAALLLARPDLAAPPSGSFTALAARAGARPSVEAALADLDAPTLAVAEAVLALGTQDVDAIAAGLGLPEDDVVRRLAHLRSLALVVEVGPVAGLVDALGPHPLGLGPVSTRERQNLPPSLTELENGVVPGDQAGSADALRAQADSEPLSEAALAMLRVLTWGPPVGTVRAGGRATGAAELIERGWLERDADSSGRTRLVLPREVGLALRGGRLLREPLAAPDTGDLDVVDPAAVAAEAARLAEEAVRLTGALLDEWGREGGAILRTGGVGVRALARTVDALEVETSVAASLIEVAAGARLLGLDEAGATWVPASTARSWRAAELPERWAPLAAGWAVSARTPWLVGTRNDDGSLRPVLGADVEAPWAAALRRRVLLLLADLPEGAAATADYVVAALIHARPRRPVPEGAVTAVLAEAELLGVTAGGVLSRGGQVLAGAFRSEGSASGAPGSDDAAAGPATEGELLAALEDALAADLPAPVDMLLVQSDLTAIVPGRPSPELAAVLERASVVESRGGALTVRLTPDSVRGALDAGWSGAELLETLGRFSPTPLPATLTSLVDDAARRHGAVRVREVASVLRVPDPATAAGLLADERLADLGLDEVAPGILLATAPAGQVLRELRAGGLAPVLEDATGRLLVTADGVPGRRRGAPAPEPASPGGEVSVRRRRPSTRELATLVGRLRAGEEARAASGAPAGAATDPVHALALLRQAQTSRARLLLRLAGPDGKVQERRVRVLAVEPGRVRLADVVRETELTVAVHRIVSVEAV
ncbi:helicase-associated domain-containing protein [Actinomyces haliotis]|uniref:helicase-associated domain-containing protein n=1 Tax=Actinomyces haliotis TaxID=1280843 RepID=UPI00188E6568|nr:helicase-associated domain-containing protein [Actinomyces haliotis]